MIVERGDQYATRWLWSEGSMVGVGDAEGLAGTMDESTAVEARVGTRRADVELTSRIFTADVRVGRSCRDCRQIERESAAIVAVPVS